MPEAFWLNLSTEGWFSPWLALTGTLFFISLPFSFSWFARPVCAASHTSTPSVSNSLYLSPHQGAEAQSDTAAQRAQVPDTRLHRVSEAEVWLLWSVADHDRQAEIDNAEKEKEREREREGGREVVWEKKMFALLQQKPIQHRTWEADVLVFSTELLTEQIWIGRHPLSEMWI